jgi:hypothetical protein
VAKNGRKGYEKIVYSDERSDIYTGTDSRPLEAAIDQAISRLRATIALAKTNQSPKEHMYETPRKAIDGQLAPYQNSKGQSK